MSRHALEMPARVRRLVEAVAAERQVAVREILSERRGMASVAHARMDAIARARKLQPTPSFPLIGSWFGRDHSTVMRACRLMAQAQDGAE